MDVETRLLVLQHLHRTALRTLAGAGGTLPPAVKKRVFATVEALVWSLPPSVFDAAEGADPEARAAAAVEDPRVAERFEATLTELQGDEGA